MKRSLVFRLVLLTTVLTVLLGGAKVWAVTGPNTVATNGFPWVVRLTDQSGGPTGTGSYITNGVVLTAAHCVTFARQAGPGVTNFNGQSSDRVTIGGQQYFALGVADPLYANLGADPNDIGLYLVLNQPAVPGGVLPALATSADAALNTGSTVAVLGFGKSPKGGLPIFGTMTMSNAAYTTQVTGLANVTPNTYAFTKPPSSEMTDPGDSGGPYIANIGGVNKIVAVHTTGFTSNGVKVAALGVRVDSHTDFVTGNGQNMGAGVYQATLVRMTNTAATTWSAAGSWIRASTNFNMAPQINDVAILDPTTASDAGTVVTLDVNTANLNGLLSDVTLQANGHALNVGGSSGILNGGNINVTGAGSVMNIGTKLDNEGTVTIGQNGTAYIATALPNIYTTYNLGLFNGSNATLSVTAGGNLAVTNVSRYTLLQNSDASSVVSLQGDATGAATITVGRVDSYGVFNVGQRGMLQLANAFINEVPGQFSIAGGVAGGATGSVFQMINYGSVNVGAGGTLLAGYTVRNFGPIGVTGGTLLTTNFTLGFVTNISANLQFTSPASTTGSVTMTSGNIGVTNGFLQGTLNVQTGTFTMNGGNLSVDNMFVTNTAGLFSLNGGVVTTSFTRVSNGGDFWVGSNAVPASLNLDNNSHVFGNGLIIAATANSAGSVSFYGTSLLVTNGSTLLGLSGVGQMSVSNGTFTARDMTIGVTNGSQGTFLNLNTGTTVINNTFTVGAQPGATGTVLVTGGQLSILATTLVFGVQIGSAGVGSMIISNGLVTSGTTVTTVGYTNGGQGFLSVAGGTLLVNGLTMGFFGGATGTTFIAGGELDATNGPINMGLQGATGSMTITGGLVRTLGVGVANGSGSVGTLTVSGGQMYVPFGMEVASTFLAKGAVWVTGGELEATNSQFYIGDGGVGTMTVSNGTVTVSDVVVADAFLGQGSLTVAGGTMTITNSLRIADGSVVSGLMNMTTGSVLITGGNLTITNGSTVVGNVGSGSLTISNVTVQTRDVTIAAQLGSAGTLTLNNGTLATTSLYNNTNGFIMGVGTIAGPVTNAGTISPGFSPGTIFITGKLTLQPSSTVVMELGGTDPADYDHIIISNALQADGTLNVSLINSFAPADGNTFDIFGFTSASGQFAITNLPALNPGLSWDTSNLMTMGELAVVPEPSSLLLVFTGCGLGVLLFRRRSRRDT